MYTIRQGSRVYINAPAKLNLFLELHRRRSDGYHEMETLMVPVDVYDSLSLSPRDDGQLHVRCNWMPGTPSSFRTALPPAHENIVFKVLSLLQQEAETNFGADVELSKRIPTQAGLGGGSSDAAAALLAANAAWSLNWPRGRLAEVGAQAGSDIPFFLFDAMARCTGRGEIIEPLESNGALSFVIVKPEVGLSTPEVFQQAEIPGTPIDSQPLRDALTSMNLNAIAESLFNRLQSAASKLTPWIEQIAQTMDSLVVCGHQMSGSGTSYFAVCRNRRHARHIAARLRATRLGQIFVATALGPRWAR